MASNSKFKLAILGIILALLIAACEQLDGLGLDPQILSFTATPSGSVEAGDDVTLNWNIVGGAEDLAVTLTPGDVDLEKTGSYVVTPGETTEYVLSAKNEGNLATKTLTVEVAGTGNPSEPEQPEQPGGGDTLPRVETTLTTRIGKPLRFDVLAFAGASELVGENNPYGTQLLETPSGITIKGYDGYSLFTGCCSNQTAFFIPEKVGPAKVTFVVDELANPPYRVGYIDVTINVTEDDTDPNAPCDSRIVTVNDFFLQASISEALGTDFNDDVTCAQLGTIKELDASGNEIRPGAFRFSVTDLSGIEYAVNLENLNLRGADLSDISALIELPWTGSNDTVDLSATQNIPAEQIEALKQKVENVIQ